jgi:ABC-2 type transport system permease protein
MLASPHSPAVILLGKALGGVVIGSLQAVALLAIAALVPGIDLEWQFDVVPGILLSLAVVLLLAVFLNGFAQIMASRIPTMSGFHLVMNLLLFPLLFVSGAFFPLADLPIWLKLLATANPLSYAVDALQVAVYASDDGHFGLLIDLLVLGTLAPATFILGLGRRVNLP